MVLHHHPDPPGGRHLTAPPEVVDHGRAPLRVHLGRARHPGPHPDRGSPQFLGRRHDPGELARVGVTSAVVGAVRLDLQPGVRAPHPGVDRPVEGADGDVDVTTPVHRRQAVRRREIHDLGHAERPEGDRHQTWYEHERLPESGPAPPEAGTTGRRPTVRSTLTSHPPDAGRSGPAGTGPSAGDHPSDGHHSTSDAGRPGAAGALHPTGTRGHVPYIRRCPASPPAGAPAPNRPSKGAAPR